MDSINWGRRIKAFRKLKGYTQIQFAKKVGVSVSVMGEIERGMRTPPHDFLVKTTQILEVSLDELQPVREDQVQQV